jgi:hypothetical protein
MAVEDLNLTGPGDETTTNGNGQDNTQNTDAEINLSDGVSSSATGDYTGMFLKPIYGASNPTNLQGDGINSVVKSMAESVSEEGVDGYSRTIPGTSTTRFVDLAIMHEFLRFNGDAREAMYSGRINTETLRNASLNYVEEDFSGDRIEGSISDFGNEIVKGAQEMSELTGIPEPEFYRQLAVASIVQADPNSQYTISLNKNRDYNAAFFPTINPFSKVVNDNFYSNLLEYNFGESIGDFDVSTRPQQIQDIYNKTPDEFEQDIIRNTSGIGFNDRKDLVSTFVNASPQERVEIYRQLFSLETEIKSSGTIMSADDPVVFQVQSDRNQIKSDFKGLVDAGIITIDVPEPMEPILPDDQVSQGLDPESAGYPKSYEPVEPFANYTPKTAYEIAYEDAEKEYVGRMMEEKYGEEWKRNYNLEQFASKGINKIREIMDKTGLSYKEVLSELNGDMTPSLNPEKYGNPNATGTVYNLEGLRSGFPSRDKLSPNTPESVLKDIKSAFIKNQSIFKSVGDGAFRVRKYTDDEAFELATDLTKGLGMENFMGEFDENNDGKLSTSEAGALINSMLEDQAAEYNWLSGQKELHEQLAVAAVVLNDNRELIGDENLINLEINGIPYKVTPRQQQLYNHHMTMASEYADRFSSFVGTGIKDVAGELAYIRNADQIKLDEWAANNPKMAFLAVTMESISTGMMSTPRGAFALLNAGLAEASNAIGATEAADNYYQVVDAVLGNETTLPTSAKATGMNLTSDIEGVRYVVNADGEFTGMAVDAQTGAMVDPRISNEIFSRLSEEEITELSLGSSYERSAFGFYQNGLKIGTQILSTVTGGGIAGMYGGGAMAINVAKMGNIFTQSYDAQYKMLTEGTDIDPRTASIAAAANSVFTTITAQAFGVEFFGKASPIFNKVLGRYSDDLIKAVAQSDGVAASQVNAEILKTVLAGAGLEFTQEFLDQIQKNVTKELLMGGNAIDGLPGLNEAIDIAILSATFGGAGAGMTIKISDFTTTQQEYFAQLTKNPAQLQSRLDKAVRDGELTQEQANTAMVLAKEYIQNTPQKAQNVADEVRHQIVIEQININKDLETANTIKDDALRQETINEINERQSRLDERIDDALEMDTDQIFYFPADEIPAHLLGYRQIFNDKTSEVGIRATKREVEQGYTGDVNLVIKGSNVTDVIASNAATITPNPEAGTVTVKVIDQFKGAQVTVYNSKGDKLISRQASDSETGEVTFESRYLADGAYKVEVEGQYDVTPPVGVEGGGKTEAQIRSDLDEAIVEQGINTYQQNGIPITKLTSQEYDSIPTEETGVNPKDSKAMVHKGVIVIREDATLTPKELYHEVSHWVLTNPDFQQENKSVDFNKVIEALNVDPATSGIINPAEWQAFTRMYPEGQVSNETVANVIADLATGYSELNISSRGRLHEFLYTLRDMVSSPKATVNQDGEMSTTPSRISMSNSQDVVNALYGISQVIADGGSIDLTSLVERLPTVEGDTTPDVQATMKDSKRLQDQVDAGEISLDNETQSTKDLFQEVMNADLSAYPNLEAGRERFAKETLADPNNLATYLRAFEYDVMEEASNISTKMSNRDTDEDIDLSIQGSRLPGRTLEIIPAAKILTRRGEYDEAIRLYDEAIERSPNEYLLYLQRASVKEERNNPGDKESAALDRQEANFLRRQDEGDESRRNREVDEDARKLIDSRKPKPKPDKTQDVQTAMPEDQQEDMPEDQQEETQTTPKDDVTPAVSKEQVIDEIIAKSQRLNSEEFLNSIPNALNRRLVVMFNRDINLDRASLQALKDARLNKINEALNQALDLETFNPFLTQYIDLKSRQDSENLSNVISGLSLVDAKLFRSRVNARIRATFNSIMSRSGTIADQSQAIEAMINGVTSSMIDLAVGNSNRTDIKEALIEPWMESTGVFLLEYSNMAKEVSSIMDNAFGSKDFESKSRVESKYRVQAALLQLEFLLNPDNPKVASIEKYIDAIVEPFEGTGRGMRSQEYSRHDIKIFKQIKKDFAKLDMSSADAYLASLRNIFSPEEYSVFEDMQKMYEKLRVYNEYVNGTILGAEVVNYEGYVHHASIVMDQATELEMNTNALSATEVRSQRATETPPPTLERTTKVGPIHFDVEYVFNRAAKSLIEYAYIAPASELTATTFEKTGTKLGDKNIEIYQAIGGYIANYTQAVLNNVSSVDKTQNLLGLDGGLYSTLKRNAYRYILGGKNRISDLASNIVYATMFPQVIATGSKGYLQIWNSDMSMGTILSNVDCTIAQRIVPSETGRGGRGTPIELGKVINNREQARAYYENLILNALKQATPLMEAKAVGQLIDKFITAPDRPFAGPVWFGNMAIEFENFTGQKIDWEAIHNNDPAYMNKYASAIREARRKADESVTNMITQTGSLADMRLRILNIRNKAGGFVTDALFPMSTFHLNDIDNFKKAWVALFKEGKMTRRQATQLWAATTSRQISYFSLKAMVAQMALGLFARDEYEDDREDITIADAVKTGTIQHVASQYGLLDGNAATNMFVSSGINTAQELIVGEEVPFSQKAAYGNRILEANMRGVDHNASNLEVISTVLSLLGPLASGYGRPFFKWLEIDQELSNLSIEDTPRLNRKRNKLLEEKKAIESNLWPLFGEFRGMVLGMPAMPGANDIRQIFDENRREEFWDKYSLELQAKAEAEYIYETGLNKPIYENQRVVVTRNKADNTLKYDYVDYNGYDKDVSLNEENKQVGMTWGNVLGNVNNYLQNEIDQLIFDDLKSQFPNVKNFTIDKVQDSRFLMLNNMMSAKNKAVRDAQKSLGLEAYSIENEIKRYDNTGSRGEGYDFLMGQIGEFSYTHFGVKNTVNQGSYYGGEYGNMDVYFTYEELNELKFDEFNLINFNVADIIDGERFYSVGDIKKLYENSQIVQQANKPDLSFSREFSEQSDEQIRQWILDGHSSFLEMPDFLENKTDDSELIPLSELSDLTPYGIILDRASQGKGEEFQSIFLYGDGETHSGHSNFNFINGERIPSIWKDIPYPKSDYVRMYDASLKAP